MDFQELIRVRRSHRAYKSDKLADDVLHRVLGAARLAPSAANLQPVHVVVVTDELVLSRMNEVYGRDWFYTAPAIVVVCVEMAKAWRRRDGWSAAEVDAAIAMDHLILAATEEGLASCWVCAFDEAKAREVLGIPNDIRIVAMTPLGYPSAEPEASPRKALRDLVHRERW